METLTHISIGVASLSFLIAGGIRVYEWGYRRGYDDGKHCGFTEGLYRAAERANRHAYRHGNRERVSTSAK